MKNQTTKIKTALLFLIVILFTACNTSKYGINYAYKSLFYNYILTNNKYFTFDGVEYCFFVEYSEIQNQPQPLKNYLIKCNLLGNERITEMFFDYKGRIKPDGFAVNPTKKYSISEHCSGLEPRFDAGGKSFPFNLEMQLNKQGFIAAWLLKKNHIPDNHTKSIALDNILMLKHLGMMVWYPTAMLGHNVVSEDHFINEEKSDKSVRLLMFSSNLSASGIMWLDSSSFLPIRFEGDITDIMKKEYSINKFEFEYLDYIKIQHYYMPKTCIVTITTDNKQSVKLSMNLTDYKPVDNKSKIDGRMKIFDKKKRLQRKEDRKLKRLLRKSSKNKL